MIYEVYVDGNLLYYPNDETYSIINAVVETSLNEAGTFECDVPVSNPRYEQFNLRQSMIQVLKDNVEIFYGEIREVKQNFDFTKHVYAVGELAFLFDSIQPQAKYQTTPRNMLSSLLANHNSQVENRKKFTLGNVTVVDANNYIYHYTNREDTLTAIRDKMCATLDGYLKIRKVGNTRYLDLVPLSQYGSYCTQEIAFGENLLDYSCNYTADDVATCVIPLGERFDDQHRTAAAVDGLDEYLTIKGTSVDSYHTNTNDDYVFIQSAVNRFGWVRVVKHWDDVTVKETLKTKAEQWLTDAQWSKLEMELNAVDLNLLDHNIESFEVGDTIHCWAEPYNMDTTFPVRKKTTYLNDLSKNYIVLSNTETSKSYTKQASAAVTALKEETPEITSLMKEARDRALAMLLSETQGGYVVYEYHKTDNVPDYIEAINICNAPTIKDSTSRWRWSYNGLGFMWRDSAATMTETSPPWQGPNVAMTNDGQINADRITTGTLNANKVTVNGKVQATSGYIGNESNGWQIGNTAIYNGVTSIGGTSGKAGTYVGVSGIRNQGGVNNAAYVKIQDGSIVCNSTITASGLSSSGQITAKGLSSSAAISTTSSISAGTSISAGSSISAQSSISAKGQITTTTGQIRTSNGDINTGNGSIYTAGGNIYTLNGDIVTYSGSISSEGGYNSQGYSGKNAEFTVSTPNGTRTLKFRGGILTAY